MALDLTFRRAGVRRLHQAWSAARDDVDSHPSQLVAELLHFLVDGIASLDAGTAKDRDAIMLHSLRLDLIEVVDGLPELVDSLVQDVSRIGRIALLRLLFTQLLELRRSGSLLVSHLSRSAPRGRTVYSERMATA